MQPASAARLAEWTLPACWLVRNGNDYRKSAVEGAALAGEPVAPQEQYSLYSDLRAGLFRGAMLTVNRCSRRTLRATKFLRDEHAVSAFFGLHDLQAKVAASFAVIEINHAADSSTSLITLMSAIALSMK
jgi:hypothetical protein